MRSASTNTSWLAGWLAGQLVAQQVATAPPRREFSVCQPRHGARMLAAVTPAVPRSTVGAGHDRTKG